MNKHRLSICSRLQGMVCEEAPAQPNWTTEICLALPADPHKCRGAVTSCTNTGSKPALQPANKQCSISGEYMEQQPALE